MFMRTVVNAVSGISLLYCTGRYVCGIGQCVDISMEPTIKDGDVVLITPFHVHQNLLMKGDVVFCRSPKNVKAVICKRIIGMEGDTVIDSDSGQSEMVNKGHVWLEGDNKDASIDSRAFGAVPSGLLLSKVSFRVWPLNRIGILSMIGEQS